MGAKRLPAVPSSPRLKSGIRPPDRKSQCGNMSSIEQKFRTRQFVQIRSLEAVNGNSSENVAPAARALDIHGDGCDELFTSAAAWECRDSSADIGSPCSIAEEVIVPLAHSMRDCGALSVKLRS